MNEIEREWMIFVLGLNVGVGASAVMSRYTPAPIWVAPYCAIAVICLGTVLLVTP